jgi:hypothetical protein
MNSSTPHFSEFNPKDVPYQFKVIKDIYKKYDYKLGTHEVLLSGSVGSAKSILMAHIAVRHCIENNNARILLGRKAMPDLKDTIFNKILEHLEGSDLKEGIHYWVTHHTAKIRFATGSEIISRSWADKKYLKMRSLEISAAIIEELTENDDKDKAAYDEIKMRVGRLPHVKKKFILCATNPSSPSHWAYKYFFTDARPTRHVYLSRTEDNKFLPEEYIRQLKQDLDPKQARRMIYGEWIEIEEERVYHSYDSDKQFKKETEYGINPYYPVAICFDFNIALGKPMSSCAYQYINDHFHVFDQKIVEGARTSDIMDEWFESGILTKGYEILVHGDATGAARDTRSILSDYDVIKKYLSNIPGLKFKMEVPRENPPIRTRHNRLNAYCMNELGQCRMTVYKKAKTVDEGLRLTALKPGANYVEDDSKAYQHVTTALGYGIYYDTTRVRSQISSQKR